MLNPINYQKYNIYTINYNKNKNKSSFLDVHKRQMGFFVHNKNRYTENDP